MLDAVQTCPSLPNVLLDGIEPRWMTSQDSSRIIFETHRTKIKNDHTLVRLFWPWLRYDHNIWFKLLIMARSMKNLIFRKETSSCCEVTSIFNRNDVKVKVIISWGSFLSLFLSSYITSSSRIKNNKILYSEITYLHLSSCKQRNRCSSRYVGI